MLTKANESRNVASKVLLILALIVGMFCSLCFPLVANATENAQTIELGQKVQGTMSVSMQETLNPSSLALTGDNLVWIISLILIPLLIGSCCMLYRAYVMKTTAGSHVNVSKRLTSTNKVIAAAISIIVAISLVAGFFATATEAKAAGIMDSAVLKSEIVVDSEGNVIENNLVVNNATAKDTIVKSITAPEG